MLEILYQDDHIVVINKPSGLLVHRTHLAKEEEDVVVQRLRDQTGKWVFPVHRLDRGTSGVLVMAFSPKIASILAEQFATAQTQKTYLSLVRGFCAPDGLIDHPLPKLNEKKGRSRFKIEGTEKEAQTRFSCLTHYELPISVSRYQSMRLSWIEVFPNQGRKHQIRRHLKHIFHPIVGDSCYGCRHINKVLKEVWSDDFRLQLHARRLHFLHPVTEEPMSLTAELDSNMTNVLKRLAQYEVDKLDKAHHQ